jgi:plastocyanin
MNTSNSYTNRASHLFSKLLLAAVAFLSPLYAVAATHDVAVRNNFFTPNDLTIEVGDTVRWTNNGGFHDVTADDGSFNSAPSNSFTFSRTFTSVAEILYHCSVHSSAGRNINSNMNGRINVVAAAITTDVSVESVNAIDGSYKAGEDFRVMTTLKNNSGAASGMVNVSFYASSDNNITTGDTLLGTKAINNIAAGASQDIDESIDLPANLAAGDYFIGAIIDIDDSNLNNNTNVDAMSIFVFTVFTMNAGLNDAWFNPLTDGQGFFITIFPNLSFVSLAWFTYDTELPPLDATANLGDPGNRWITGAAGFIDNQAVINIVLTSGGLFDDPTVVQRTEPAGADGTLILTFENCNSGTVEYNITAIDAQGTVPIQRVVTDNVALCEAFLRESQPDP